MSHQVLIIQPDTNAAQPFLTHFESEGDSVWHTADPHEARDFLKQTDFDLVVIDLHLSDGDWEKVVSQLLRKQAATNILFTTSYPDPDREQYIRKNFQPCIILQPPFNHVSIEQAVSKLTEGSGSSKKIARPRVRFPMRIKITLPYILLSLLLAMVAAYVINRVVLDSIEERYTNQLIEVGKLTNDWMVREENRLLETLRLLAYTQGVPEAVAAGDGERLRELALPLAVNYQEETIEILNNDGVSQLSLRHKKGGNVEEYRSSQGESVFSQWDFVRKVLDGRMEEGRDKYVGLARAPWGDYLYVSGPVIDSDGNQTGVILVGKTLPTLAREIRADTLSHITIYNLSGQPIESTLLAEEDEDLSISADVAADMLARQNEETLIRPLTVASINYSEILGPWELGEYIRSTTSARTNNDQGLVGAALAETFLVHPSQVTRLQIFLFSTISFFLVIALGLILANRITRPLLRVVDASEEVAEGNLDVQVDSTGDDEVAILAYSFNKMVSGLREGSLYRDLLGRTVSPEVREELRHGFASGDLRLEGQEAVATVLTGNIRGFTTLSENEEPTVVLNWLNEYFDILVPIIMAHEGVVSKFEGDAILVFFGILPRPLSAQESAAQACKTALAMLEAIEELNQRRAQRGDPSFTVGIGVNTGPVTAGALGSTDRLHYTIIGDTVNTTFRLESLTQQLGGKSSAIVSQHTLFSLKEQRNAFNMEPLGAHTLRGKVEQLLVYHLRPFDEGAS